MKLFALLLSTMMAAVALGAFAPVTAFHRDDLPVVSTTNGPGSASFGLKLVNTGGEYAADLMINGPAAGQEVSIGAFFYDANKNLVFGFAFTGHSSPDRLILVPTASQGDAAGLPAGLTYHVDTAATDSACNFACAGIEGSGAGTLYAILWGGAGSSSALEVRGTGVTATVNSGSALVVGDADLTNGSPNVQVQQTAYNGVLGTAYVNAAAGAKVISGAHSDLNVAHHLTGFFGDSDFKLACQFAVGACLWKSDAAYLCSSTTGVNCDTTSISWNGASGSGTGYGLYFWSSAAPGAYSFNVDSKVDPYGPSVYDPTTGTFVFLGEDYSFVTVADVDLP